MLKGNMKRFFNQQTRGVKSNDKKKSVCIPFSLIEMERNIREIADVTRTDNPFKDTRRGDVITRKKVAVV